MSSLFSFTEYLSTPNYNYNGNLDINKYSLYIPIILNKKYTYVCDNPFNPSFGCILITRSTKVMSGIHTALRMYKLQWRTPRRMRYMG